MTIKSIAITTFLTMGSVSALANDISKIYMVGGSTYDLTSLTSASRLEIQAGFYSDPNKTVCGFYLSNNPNTSVTMQDILNTLQFKHFVVVDENGKGRTLLPQNISNHTALVDVTFASTMYVHTTAIETKSGETISNLLRTLGTNLIVSAKGCE